MVGNDLATLPDFPAEIRAPAGTPHGVSAFQIHFASRDILTPGDHPNVLVAMNPAALITNVAAVEKGGTVIVNEDGFTEHNLRKAGYEANPLDDDTLDDYQVFRVPMTSMTVRATEDIEGITSRDAARARTCSRSGSCPGCTGGRPSRPSTGSRRSSPTAAVRGGQPGRLPGGLQLRRDRRAAGRPLRGRARARARHLPQRERHAGARLGLIAASVQSGLQLFYASYPITPASELLHALAAPPLRRAHDPGRGRDRRRRTWRSAPRSRATSASPPRAARAWT